MRANLEQIILKHSPDIHDLERLLDKIEQVIATQPKVPLNVRMSEFKRDVFAWNHRNKEKYSQELLLAFINLWCRVGSDGNLKFENETKFMIGGRLATFSKMHKQFQQSSQLSRFRQAGGNPLFKD